MKILVINGHPNPESLNHALADAFIKGASIDGKNEVRYLQLSNMEFNPNLSFGYSKRVELETDLLEVQEWVKWCEHLVIIHPIWWGGLPAQLKGLFDRAFLPGFAFKYHEKGVWWDKLLAGRTAEILYTIDQPIWYYKLINGAPGLKQLKKMILSFCGFKVKQVTGFANVRFSTPDKRAKWLERASQLGNKC
jgi:putative NADPH-quinone reductase